MAGLEVIPAFDKVIRQDSGNLADLQGYGADFAQMLLLRGLIKGFGQVQDNSHFVQIAGPPSILHQIFHVHRVAGVRQLDLAGGGSLLVGAALGPHELSFL